MSMCRVFSCVVGRGCLLWLVRSLGKTLLAFWQKCVYVKLGFPDGSDNKESACNAGDLSSVLGLGRYPWVGHGNPLQYSCLENSMDRGAWWVTNRWTWLSHLHFHNQSKEIHCSLETHQKFDSSIGCECRWDCGSSVALWSPLINYVGPQGACAPFAALI